MPFLRRAVWFFLVGWWLSAVFIVIDYAFTVSVIGAPIGCWFLNRIPQAQTLRLRNNEFVVTQQDGIAFLTQTGQEQLPW